MWRLKPLHFALSSAASCADRFVARLVSDSRTGTNSPFDVLSSLMGKRAPSGSMLCFAIYLCLVNLEGCSAVVRDGRGLIAAAACFMMRNRGRKILKENYGLQGSNTDRRVQRDVGIASRF
jgi:hypothetical protein